MKLSAPVYVLKHQAKQMSRREGIPRLTALDRIAAKEGYERWSLLISKVFRGVSPARVYARLKPGELMLLGARPRQGKTLFGLQLTLESVRAGRPGFIFTLEETEAGVMERLRFLGEQSPQGNDLLQLDCSDRISVTHIMEKMARAPAHSLAVIDYLQLLDQKRENPDLTTQVRALRNFARSRNVVLVFLSQIDRAFELSGKAVPGPEHVRLPNPLDLALFDKVCFLGGGEVRAGDGAVRSTHAQGRWKP